MMKKKYLTPYDFLKSLCIAVSFRRGGPWMLLAVFLSSCAQEGANSTTVTATTVSKGPSPEVLSPTATSTSTSTYTSAACTTGPTNILMNYFPENPKASNPALTFSQAPSETDVLQTNLANLVGNCILESDRYILNSDTLFPSYITRPSNPVQTYAPTSPEFQQLNSFYHANSLRNLMNSLGANFSSAAKVKLDAHCDVESNAYFSPSTNQICLGYVDLGASKKVWAADDGDVVIHEVGHSVNHHLSSTDIMNSTQEAGAIDESIADYWALTIMNDGQLSEWFLGAIGNAYVRDATQNISYPLGLVNGIHDDSRILTQVLWDLRSASNLGKNTTDALVKRAVQLLPATSRYGDFYEAFYDASGPAFLNLSNAQRSLIVSKFTNKGLHRADSAAGIRLSTVGSNKPIYIIDDHTYSFQKNGNCNGVLDVNETAMILVNLENTNNVPMGVGQATITSTPNGITVPSGGGFGDFFRLRASSDFVNSLPANSSNSDDAVLWASFIVKATSSGAKNFTLSFRPMYSDPTETLAKSANVNVNFSVTVGSAATSSNCTNANLWP
jgi:hypothetical protein